MAKREKYLTGDLLDYLVNKYLGIKLKMANKYIVKVPAIATVDPEEIELKGPPLVYKNGKPVKGSENRLVMITIPIWRILEIYEEGYPILLANRKDLPRLINDIERIINDLEGNPLVSYKEYVEKLREFLDEIMRNNGKTVERILSQPDERLAKYGITGEGFLQSDTGVEVVAADSVKKDKKTIDLSGVEVYYGNR